MTDRSRVSSRFAKVGLAAFVVVGLAALPASAQIIVDQPPNQVGGLFADSNGPQSVADNFVVTTDFRDYLAGISLGTLGADPARVVDGGRGPLDLVAA